MTGRLFDGSVGYMGLRWTRCWPWRWRAGLGGPMVGLAGAVGGLGAALVARSAAAQSSTPPEMHVARARLTIHPHEVGTGTRTAHAGWQPLEVTDITDTNDTTNAPGVPDVLQAVDRPRLYVPAACAGTRRCPLVVFHAGDSVAAHQLVEVHQPLADQYGMILLVPAYAWQGEGLPLDSLLRRALGKYAIDPDKLALMGQSSGDDVLWLGCANLDVFSRVMLLSPRSFERHLCRAAVPQNPAARLYVTGGLAECRPVSTAVRLAQGLRPAGYTPALVLTLRGYPARPADIAEMWQWLHASWAPPPAAAAGVRRGHTTDSGPLLTARALAELTTFWRRFMQEPDSVRETARRAHQQTFTVPVRTARFTLSMMDTPALAAAYPSVAAALRAAGLTARQADRYRAALVIAAANLTTAQADWEIAPVAAGSVLGRNLAFMQGHTAALKVLGATGMWTTP